MPIVVNIADIFNTDPLQDVRERDCDPCVALIVNAQHFPDFQNLIGQ